jgi:predicted transposase YdaD
MLQVHDIRETRVYREAKEEGREEGIKEGIKQGIKEGIKQGMRTVVIKLAASQMMAEEIAQILGLQMEEVREAIQEAEKNNPDLIENPSP